ncbi:ABC transporter ATP-binding protein [Halorussus halophilus]|uniref:ABC transporter ATP-binding protein n=1 Tax=Halorussus halophilus TaxID=2650975 RepID=UPI0013017807|nr:ABC transporter ATP-binding protein [Halorussus halophilus]
MAAIELRSLQKQFGDFVALRGVDLTVEEGEVFGFLGPNGAGKSTTINIMLDFMQSSAGSALVFGRDAQKESREIRRRTGALLEGYGVYPRLTGREHVQHAIETKDASDDPDELLARVNLSADADRRAEEYSKGMAQRMAIAVALVGDPDLLVLDEPSTGLDPNGARTLRRIVSEEAADGTTVFFSSHVLEDVQAVADRVGILLDGRLEAEGSITELRRQLGAGTTLEVEVGYVPSGLVERLQNIEGVRNVTTDVSKIAVSCEGDGQTKLDALTTVADAGVFQDFAVREISLSDVFSEYTEAKR